MIYSTQEKAPYTINKKQLTWESPHGRILPQAQSGPLIMGVLNTTPNSFSNDGVAEQQDKALSLADKIVEEGVDIIDIGGVPTRPPLSRKVESERPSILSDTLPDHDADAYTVSIEEELARVLPTLKSIRAKYPHLPISVDTTRPQVAEAAIRSGADIINDQKALCEGVDIKEIQQMQQAFREGRLPENIPHSPMAKAIADLKCPVILMHNRVETHYDDFWAELVADFRCHLALAENAGIAKAQIWVDPGFCFGKEPRHNLEMVKNIHKLHELEAPILLGTSRKSTIGKVLNSPINERIPGTITTTIIAAMQGVQMVRVHDVLANRQATRMMDAIQQGLHFDG